MVHLDDNLRRANLQVGCSPAGHLLCAVLMWVLLRHALHTALIGSGSRRLW